MEYIAFSSALILLKLYLECFHPRYSRDVNPGTHYLEWYTQEGHYLDWPFLLFFIGGALIMNQHILYMMYDLEIAFY